MSGVWLRRALHAGSAGILLLVPLGSWLLLRWVVVGLTAVVLGIEVMRLRWPAARAVLQRVLPVFRAREASRPSGAAWLWLGYAIAVWVPPPAGGAGILVGSLADPAAAAAGDTWGPGGVGKTWIGSAACLVVAWLVLGAAALPWPAVVGGGIVAAGTERWSRWVDDNLVVAPGTALAVFLLA